MTFGPMEVMANMELYRLMLSKKCLDSDGDSLSKRLSKGCGGALYTGREMLPPLQHVHVPEARSEHRSVGTCKLVPPNREERKWCLHAVTLRANELKEVRLMHRYTLSQKQFMGKGSTMTGSEHAL